MSVPVDLSPGVGLPELPEGAVKGGVLSPAERRAAERERLALAQKLHDTLCQSLSAVRLIATLAERKATQSQSELKGDLSELRRIVGTVCDEVHRFVDELRTPPR